MADQHRDDDEVLADLERSLADGDRTLADRLTAHSTDTTWPVRPLILTWLVWVTTWFATFIVTGNAAALVLAVTSSIAFPLGLAVAYQLRRRLRHHRHHHGSVW
jgi:hypothetical protein